MRKFQFSVFHNLVDIIFRGTDAVVLHIYASDTYRR